MINFLEFKEYGYIKMACLSLLAMISQVVLLLFLRGHYTIDMFASFIFGHYFWYVGHKLSYYIDVKILHIPFHKRYPKFQKKC